MQQALIQVAGRLLQGGELHGSARISLERAAGGDTPVLTLRSEALGSPVVRLLLDTGATSHLLSHRLRCG